MKSIKNKEKSIDTYSGLRNAIQKEVLRAWDHLHEDTNEPRKIKIIDFAKDWIRNNVTSNPPHVLIQRYDYLLSEEDKHKEKIDEKYLKRTQKKGMPNQTSITRKTEFTLSEISIKHWIENRKTFESKSW